MKKLVTIAAIMLLICLLFLTGCPSVNGRPPEFPVANPYAIPDGSGGVIVAYQVNKGSYANAYVQRLGAQGDALWGEKGIELGADSGLLSVGNEGDFAALVPDGRGNVTVVYSLDRAVWTRQLDINGNPVWEGEDAKRISPADVHPLAYFKAIGNTAGGIIIAWAGGSDNLSLQKCDSDTNWYTSISTPDLDKFDIASDDSGNTFVIWKDNPDYSEGNIFIQKVDANGQIAWPSDGGIYLPGLAYVGGKFDSQIIADGEGGALAIWVHAVQNEEGRNITGLDLYTQHISSEGEMLWGESGAFIARVAHFPRLIGGSLENAMVFWGDFQSVYAQKTDAAGNTSWPEAGIKVGQAGESSNVMYYCAASDGSGGFVIVWNYSKNGNKFLHAQRMDADGNKLWGDNGIKVSSVSPYWAGYSTPARISPDGSGGFLVTWAVGEHIKDKTSSYIQRISGDGKLLWGEDGIRLDS